jgi:hypothetical protein
MNRFVRSVCAGTALLAGCGAQSDDGAGIGGETHFLITCGDECGAGLTCIDGACTRSCEPGYSSCSELSAAAACVNAPQDAAAREVFGGTCDVLCAGDADCASLGSGYFCRSGACRAEPEARQAELALLPSMRRPTLVRAVDIDTCLTGLRWVGGDNRSAEMQPGSDCVGCHREAGARALMLGGTVYPTGGPGWEPPLDGCFGLEGVEVIVEDAEGRQLSTLTNRAGNFYFEGRESELAMPYSVSMPWTLDGREVVSRMFTQPSYGGCARCHSASAVPTGPFDGVPPAEVVFAAPAIFTPGLFPNPE